MSNAVYMARIQEARRGYHERAKEARKTLDAAKRRSATIERTAMAKIRADKAEADRVFEGKLRAAEQEHQVRCDAAMAVFSEAMLISQGIERDDLAEALKVRHAGQQVTVHAKQA